MGSTTFCPLAMGILTGKYSAGIPAGSRFSLAGYEWLRSKLDSAEGQSQIEKTRRLQALADEAGLAVHHLALLWCLQNPHVSSVILGASRIDQLQDNLEALHHAHKMTPQLMEKIEDIVDNRPDPFSRF